MAIKKTTAILICIIMGACSPWSEQELGDGFFFLPSYIAMDVGFDDGSLIYKSTQKNYYQTILIQGGILEVNKDNRFILVGQNERQMDMNILTEVFYYWIIDKPYTIVYGPFTYSDYLDKKSELKIPKKLKLKCEK